MSGTARQKVLPTHTLEEFLARESRSTRRHEFHSGTIVAMAGGTPAHSLLSANITAALHRLARNSTCRIFSSDLMIWIPASRRLLYPDVAVICGPIRTHRKHTNLVENPKLIVEVSSPSTQDYDQASKFQHYQGIPEFSEYLTISASEPLVVHHLKQPNSAWLSQTYRGLRTRVPLSTFPKGLTLRTIYSNVALG